jgi:hypothetical protein
LSSPEATERNTWLTIPPTSTLPVAPEIESTGFNGDYRGATHWKFAASFGSPEPL